jgi:predicted RNA-binding protein
MDELYGFPVNKMILDRKFNDALDMEYEGKDLSQARKVVEKVYSLIQELDTFSSYDFQINDIVNKELMSYFQGEKPLKEVLQNIDRKIYLYLNE